MGITTSLESSTDTRDLQQVDASTWPLRRFPGGPGRRAGVIPVVMKQSILNAIRRHGQERTDVEICGVLVGKGYRDDEGPFIYVEGAIRGDHAASQVAQVTFTGQTWNHIHTLLDSVWPEHRILAWYHTHPGFGVFLSEMDLFIHENFFAGPDQFALVYDPLSGDEGVFIWQQGKPFKAACLVEPDEAEEPRRWLDDRSRPGDMRKATSWAPTDFEAAISRLQRRQWLTIAGLAIVGLLAIVWPLLIFEFLRRGNVPRARERNDWGGSLKLERDFGDSYGQRSLPRESDEATRAAAGSRTDSSPAPTESVDAASATREASPAPVVEAPKEGQTHE